MTKRVVALALTILLVFPVLITAGVSFLMQKSQFEIWDEAYNLALKGALGYETENSGDSSPLAAENRYIVKFDSNADLKVIEKALNGLDYELLSESKDRLFAVSLENEDFLNENQNIIDYSERDSIRSTLAVVNDPVSLSAYEAMNVYSAWDIAKGNKNVIVAVLDTGVARTHEDLTNANILPGYDAISRKSGVNEDSAGHGTAVIGLIAATANNGLGIAGISHGVTILPVKVSTGGTNIYSSDLVKGIRFAADSGAKVINMSIGGYSHSAAEQEAVNYARSKGCILISAAGNGGNSEYADQLSYPASYEGVISVASCNDLGEHSSFSQRNDMVDIAAPGENITIPFVDEEGNSVYRTDNGTSFSCAFVSGIAALAASQIKDSARFGNDEFVSLFIEACGTDKDNQLGHGVINAEKVVNLSKLPIITGVVNGENYSETVTIGFNRGKAILDGDAIEDGEVIVANGSHTLVVTDGNNKKTVKFKLDHTPLSYKFREFSSYAYFEFEKGNASLNGFPYKSKDRITTSGVHEFILTEGDEKVSKTVDLRYFLPTVYGISEGETYDRPIEITTVGDGDVLLNGKEIKSPFVVSQSGDYTLTVKSGNGAIKKDYKFKVDYNAYKYQATDYANGTAAIDSANGYICLYGDSLVGARIYDINNPSKYKFFLSVGRVYGHAFSGDKLYLFGDDGVTVIDRNLALTTKESVVSTFDSPLITYYTYANGSIYGFGDNEMYVVDLETESTFSVAELGFKCEKAFYYNEKFYLLASTDGILRVYNPFDNTLAQLDLGVPVGNSSACFGAGHISVGNRLYNADNGELVFEFAGTHAIRIAGTWVYTPTRIFDYTTAKEVGNFPFEVFSIARTNENNWLFGVDSQCAIITPGIGSVYDFGAAARRDKDLSAPEKQTEYRTNFYYGNDGNPLCLASSQNTAYALYSDSFSVYRINTQNKTDLSPIPLKFKPLTINCGEGYLLVNFADVNLVYLAKEETADQGKYIKLPDLCTDSTIFNGRLLAVVNGKIISVDLTTEAITETEISAKDLVVDQNFLYVFNEGVISKYDNALTKTEFEIATAEKGRLMIGNGIAIGKSVYNKENGQPIVKIGESILEHKGNVVVTQKGVYDLEARQYFGSTGIPRAKFSTIGGNNAVIAMGDGRISVNFCAEGEDITTKPNISGIENFGVYLESTTVNYDHGVGYIDGVPHKSGKKISGVGAHVFSLSLPCGRTLEISFNIEARLSKIQFLAENITMSVGEKVALHVVYLPEGARSVPVTYKYDANGLEISENGEVSALTVGKYRVTAEAKTDIGVISAKTTIIVRDDLIAFAPESNLTIDRNNMLVLGILPGTKVSDFTSMISTGKTVEITDANGKPVNDYIGSGNKITLSDENGNETDMLYAVIRGDNDGDGFITGYDLYVQERVLKGYQYSAPFVASADTNGNGILADNDYRTLKKILFGRIDAPLGTPKDGLFGKCNIQTLSTIRKGDTIEVAVCINGSKYARSVFGRIAYSEGLEFLGGDSVGWEADCFSRDGVIRFYAFDENGESCDSTFKTLITLKFKVNAEAKQKISFAPEKFTVSYEGRCESLSCDGLEIEVAPESNSDFAIQIPNAEAFEFSKDKKDYDISLPYHSALADISVSHTESQMVSFTSYIIPDSGKQTIVVTFNDENGTTEFYNINVTRNDVPDIDSNCKLQSLEIEGHKLSPRFSPDFFDYSISVPYGTEKINVFSVAQNITATVVIGDTTLSGENTDVHITVGAPDGETLVYTIHVKMLPPEDKPESQPVTEPTFDGNESDSDNSKTIWIIIASLIVGATVTFVAVKLTKQATEESVDENDEPQTENDCQIENNDEE